MKKLIILTIATMILIAAPMKAGDNPIKLFGGLGFGTGDFRNLALNLGAEFGITEQISIVGAFDYYFSPEKESIDGVDVSLFTLGAFAKYNLNETFFVKAGLIYAKAKAETDFYGYELSGYESKIGFAGGAGLELPVSDTMSAQIGADIHKAGSATWVKFYGNFCFKIN